MVLVWIGEASSSVRQLGRAQPLHGGKRANQRFDLRVPEPLLHPVEQQIQQTVEHAAVTGLADVTPLYRYDHMKQIPNAHRRQYRYWMLRGADVSEILVFGVERVTNLESSVPLDLLCPRTTSQIYHVLGDDSSMELFEALEAADRFPEWLLDMEEPEESEDFPVVVPPVPEPVVAEVPDAGLNTFIAVKTKDKSRIIGWEVKCNHPDHQTPIACRKNIRNNAGGRTPEVTIHMLQVWLAWGSVEPDRESHKTLWDDVVLAQAAGTLPEVVAPVLEWG